MTVRIVTDSTADIPAEQAKALGITVVPLTVFFGDDAYLDGIDLDNATFYQKLQTGKVTPRTSQPPPAAFTEAFTGLINDGADSILAVHVSSKLSGTYQSARTGLDSLPDDLRKIPIEIVDSATVSNGMGYAVMQAAKEAQQGDSLEEIQTRIHSRLSRTQILFVLDTLEYLKRGGRVGSAKAFLGNMLSVKPILAIKNGMVVGLEQPRTRGRANARIAQLVGEMRPFEHFAIVESDAEAGQQLASALKEIYPHEIPTYKLGAAVGTYAGPGTAGVILVTAQ
jgi:DegV family protein with EDD domain